MQKFLVVLVFLFFGLSSQAAVAPADKAAPATPSPPADKNDEASNITLLFIQQADSGTLTVIPKKPGSYYLTLYGVSPYIIYFSVRPHRIRGIIPTQNFVQSWNAGGNGYRQINPNAVITANQVNNQPNKNTTTELVILSSPQYDMSRNILRYVVSPLVMSSFELQEIHFDYVTLLISN